MIVEKLMETYGSDEICVQMVLILGHFLCYCSLTINLVVNLVM